ncbi:MAG: PLP-dependent aspartate aminotransferase family protein [Prolixibacteraceae bacterium]|jgi:cystathionine beta-lyase/cystathionine gamma-synthase|nr:PLP-dependent aspartate aminotransferase family protein [Prolixibacteraceae bacterium]
MNTYKFSTLAIHAGQEPDPATGAIMTPIYASSTFVQSSPGKHKGYEYSRSANPTRTALENCMAELENGKAAFAFSSGLAAENTILEMLEPGSHVIAMEDLYGGTFRLFEKVKKISANIETSFIDLNNEKELIASIKSNTKLIWIETPTNPMLTLVDLEKVAAVAKKHGIITVCDNTFATPYLQQPFDFGVDIVAHSATKFLNGHSDLVAGIVVVKDEGEILEKIKFLQNATGAILSPFDSFLLLRGLKTLPVRMKSHGENAKTIAEFLENHQKVEKVIYPGLKSFPQHDLARKQMKGYGGIITFFLKGGLTESKQFLENTKLFSLAESLGGVESLIEHPAIMTHASVPAGQRNKLGIHDNLIRVSVGIEDVDDLKEDLSNALEKV